MFTEKKRILLIALISYLPKTETSQWPSPQAVSSVAWQAHTCDIAGF